MNNKSLAVRGVVALAVVAGAGSALGAGSAVAGPLPGGSAYEDLGGGTSMTAKLVEERVSYQRSGVAGVPTSREVWVSGKVRVSLTGKATGGIIKGGYVVGCQVNLAGVGFSGNSTANQSGMASAGAGSTMSLGPGQAAYVPIINQTNSLVDADNELYRINGYKFAGTRASVAYSQEPLRVNGCAGYAQARARMSIQVTAGGLKSETVLWGKPFSLG
ncbi:MspA family porin [Gordonia rubripertincta]|uniref:MspA family porin n=1 Tax=Gordonia rubripertincta TaxID=36822 RepID=UPI000B8D2B47|nr:MspA family porin [Gordonia rubripertincta]ASR01392.1 MspA [Gordonia rubripertincta]QMU22276.1 MspA family porin [Gordonia rubripertincta]